MANVAAKEALVRRIRCGWIVVASLACTTAGCDAKQTGVDDSVYCAYSGSNFGIDVLTAAGAPASGLAISDSVPRTGATFPIPNAEERPGHYVILNTLLAIDSLGDSPTRLIVRGAGTSGRFVSTYVFGPLNQCEYGKLAGADTVIAE